MSNTPKKTGWFPDIYDEKDFNLRTGKINTLIQQIRITRTCTDLLGFLDTFVKQLEDEDDDKLTDIKKQAIGHPHYEDLKEYAKLLKSDLDGILVGLMSGVDLISALPDTEVCEEVVKPLPPPISYNIVKILIDKEYIDSKKGERISVDSLNDKGLRTIRHILLRGMPLGQYEKLEDIVDSNIENKDEIDDLPNRNNSKNRIKVVPRDMYDISQAEEAKKIRLPLNEGLSEQLKRKKKIHYSLPDVVDLSYWCSEVKKQGENNSCTSHAVAALVEYFQNRIAESTNPNFTPAKVSTRFLYKVTRRLGEHSSAQKERLKNFLKDSNANDIEFDFESFLQELNDLTSKPSIKEKKIDDYVKSNQKQEFINLLFDPGASLRQTLKALQLFGVPSDKFWPEKKRNDNSESHGGADFPDFLTLDHEPPQFCYAFAQNYQAAKYFRLDYLEYERCRKESGDRTNETANDAANDSAIERLRNLVLLQIKAVLAAGFPAVCGFPYHPEQGEEKTGEIKVPDKKTIIELKRQLKDGREKSGEIVGHAVLVVGYNDNFVCQDNNGNENKGAFLFQNSYGPEWGKFGYGWLPYQFVLEGLATDWWSLLNAEWVEAGSFGLDTRLGGDQKTPGGG